MSKLMTLLASLAFAFTTFATTSPEIKFLDTYDQLNNVIGQTGHWFVRDAAGTKTGQHGDPTVIKGWAMYTWDTRISAGKAGWIKICEQESMDAAPTESLLRDYLKRSDFETAMKAITNGFVTVATFNTTTAQIKSTLSAVNTRSLNNESEIASVKSDMTKVITKVKEVTNKTTALEAWSLAASNNVLTAAISHTDTEVGNLRTWSEAASNNVLTAAKAYTDGRLGAFKNDGREVTIGAGATNVGNKASINIDSYAAYPSSVSGDFNINLGIDNIVGDYEGTIVAGNPYHARYAVAIGTSARASKMHSYAWGSQINAFAANSTVMGYGLTATNEYATVIGHGSRTIHDHYFSNETAMVEFLCNPTCTNEIFVGFGILCGSGPGCSHIVESVLTTPDPETGMYATIRSGPYDIEVGYRKWFYGKSHGCGTVNLVAIGDGVNDYGLANVYINDRSLADWTGVNIGQPTDKEIYNKGIFGPETSHCDHDYTIAIGDNAKAVETSSSCQAIAIGRDALSAGSATVAVGPNAFAYGSLAAALGWRANAIGARSVAIGAAKMSGQNYFVDGAVNPNSDLCAAIGDDSIAIGFNAKAKSNKSSAIGYYATVAAENSVQLGMGTNDTPNTLRFMNVDIVKNGELVGNFNAKDLDPKEVDVSEGAVTEEMTIQVTAHVINTLASTNMCGPGTEIYLEPKSSRNYEVFVPNTAEFREGLPMTFESEIEDCKSLFMNGKHAFKLPVMVKVQQPCKANVIFTQTELDDDTDWTPAITNCNIYFDVSAGKFVTQKVGSEAKALQGTSLHAGTKFQVEYPISATATYTNDLQTVSSTESFMSGTFYGYVTSVELTPTKELYFATDTSWFKIHYSTVNGTANVIQKTITIE